MDKVKVINGKNRVLGRLACEAINEAKKGKQVKIINAEDIIITGRRKNTVKRYQDKFNLRNIGNPKKSPKIVSRRPDLFVKGRIRRMLAKEKSMNKKIKKRIKAYIGNPENLKAETKQNKEKLSKPHITIEKLCQEIGKK